MTAPGTKYKIADEVRRLHDSGGLSFSQIGEQLGVDKRYAHKAYHSKPTAGPLDEPERHEQSGNTWEISLPRTRIHTLDQLIAYCEVDLNEWEVDRFVVNKWEIGSAKDGQITVEPLYQVKAWLKRKVAEKAVRDIVAGIMEDARKQAPRPVAVKRRAAKSGNMLEISIADHHFGKLAWSRETGWADYDLHIARDLFNDSLGALIDRTSAHKFDEILFVVGNDLLNIDNLENTTTKGTPQSVDSRYQKAYLKTFGVVSQAIENLRAVAPLVRVAVVPGNHDTLATWHIGHGLQCVFDRHSDVVIENEPTPRKYVEFGRNMIMLTHGHTAKKRCMDLALIMAREQREMWGRCRQHEVHVGHWHKLESEEINGIRMRVMPSLCATDAWHSEQGYVGNVRSSQALVWNGDEGVIGMAQYSVHEPR